ncbi:sugar ABC transporter substrate-binding protein [Diaminobutyricibacter sp. McL0618]|uniref:sugar ABC transporter substrate-binding protein n=1 Tax=Leifsonia sp. McL0618 TaxID=3415677 RepID=UPI003CF5CB1B
MGTKKRLVIAASLILGLTLSVTACSAQTGSESAGGLSTQLPSKDTKTTINIWGYLQPADAAWIKTGEQTLKKEFPNVTVNYTYVPYDQISSKLLGTAVGGGAPDGIIYNPADSADLSKSGILADMAPFWNDFKDASQFPDSMVWKNGSKVISLQGYVNTTALYYNKDVLDKAGVKPPTTVAELDSDLKAVAKVGDQGLTMSAVPTAESEFQIFPWLLGDGQNYGSFTQSGVDGVFSQFDKWIAAGYVPRDIAGWTQADAFQNFSGGKFAFTQNGNWQLGLAKKLPFKWGVVPIPAGTSGSYSVGGGEGFSIGSKTKNAALTWEFFKGALLTESSEINILKTTGSLPARKDAAQNSYVASDPDLKVFAGVVATLKARPNSPEIAADLVTMGKIWNSVAGGSTSPSDGATQVVSQLNNVK